MNESISVSTMIVIKFEDGQTATLPEPDPTDTPQTIAAVNAFRKVILAQHSAPVVAIAPDVAA